MKVEATYLCEKAILDSQTKKMSLINIIPQNITPAGMPMYIPALSFVVVLCKDEIDTQDNYNAVLKISNNNQILTNAVLNIDFIGAARNNNIIEIQNGLMINEVGKLTFELQINDTQIKHEINIETGIQQNH